MSITTAPALGTTSKLLSSDHPWNRSSTSVRKTLALFAIPAMIILSILIPDPLGTAIAYAAMGYVIGYIVLLGRTNYLRAKARTRHIAAQRAAQ